MIANISKEKVIENLNTWLPNWLVDIISLLPNFIFSTGFFVIGSFCLLVWWLWPLIKEKAKLNVAISSGRISIAEALNTIIDQASRRSGHESDNSISTAITKLRQAAVEGKITIYGHREVRRDTPFERFSDISEEIKPEFWINFTLNPVVALYQEAQFKECATLPEDPLDPHIEQTLGYSNLTIDKSSLKRL